MPGELTTGGGGNLPVPRPGGLEPGIEEAIWWNSSAGRQAIAAGQGPGALGSGGMRAIGPGTTPLQSVIGSEYGPPAPGISGLGAAAEGAGASGTRSLGAKLLGGLGSRAKGFASNNSIGNVLLKAAMVKGAWDVARGDDNNKGTLPGWIGGADKRFFGWSPHKGEQGAGGKGGIPSSISKLQTIIQSSNLPDATRQQLTDSFNVEYQLAESDDERKAAIANLKASLIGAVRGGGVGATSYTPMSPSDIFATQQMAGRVFEPLAKSLEAQGTTDAAIINGLATALPTPALQAAARINAQHQLSGNMNLANAYRAQAQLLPSSYALQAEQSRQAQMAQQYAAQQMSGGGSGGTDFAALLAQLSGK